LPALTIDLRFITGPLNDSQFLDILLLQAKRPSGVFGASESDQPGLCLTIEDPRN
jgi:hypothetical protein